ncbi:hypothetical protein LMG28727_06903 [Paraburkholderia kirstenboschensis]|uniref:phosphoribosyltransferase-like protein n=1 Tax=Paraburkholderia kirstenboschensis TaxID=1245436 RepID=UPI000A7919D3|nr:AAA family ATPase [Paraburkholderia kirstenboschensis]CAD6559605.1 hypothetical protein LMG28727_06903 [Paraburkholderia kirstenboschensis]
MDLSAEVQPSLESVEYELSLLPQGGGPDNDYHNARRSVSRYVVSLFDAESASNMSLPDAIGVALESPVSAAQRTAAIVLLRIAGEPGVLPENSSANQLHRRLVQLVERHAPDLCRRLNFDRNAQTFEKFDAMTKFHSQICESLQVLQSLTPDLSLILTNRQAIIKAVSSDRNAAYLQPFHQQRVKAALSKILSDAEEILSCRDHSFSSRVDALSDFIEAESVWVEACSNFFTVDYYKSGLTDVLTALRELAAAAVSRFVCNITAVGSGRDIADKHYPLHEVERIVRVSIPLRNDGPGVAGNCTAYLSTNSDCIDFDPAVSLGDIPPGNFSLSFEVMVTKATDSAKLAVTFEWDVMGETSRRSVLLPVTLMSQDSNINWLEARQHHPYSTDVAEGEEFVGRTSKLNALCGRFQKDRMGSSFITGQKRVGKTSLARAVESVLTIADSRFAVLYLEWGQYSRMDPVETVEALGTEIAGFLASYIQADVDETKLNFRGSIAPLSRLADVLARESPGRKVLLILDEFDEIHPEMYRFGPLAEAFFSNLRTLSSKRNISFLLVGGEKMPFVMSAQGDQLNRFVSEGLDYFSSASEWEDYVELVRKPSRGVLTWSDAAVQAVFNATNGHPYYTKLLCAAVYQRAVDERDAVVTETDVQRCEDRVVSEMDSNSFAHLWKDGISDDRERAEIIELNRRRFLSACARSLKSGQLVSVETIAQFRQGLKIAQHEIAPIFNDYIRRGILVETVEHTTFQFSIPIFQRWLTEAGAARLMSDALAEEYETAEQQADEEARVTSSELVELAERWGPYQGREVGAERIRSWLEQVKSSQEQRLLLKLLKALRFVSSLEVRHSLRDAHALVARQIAPFVSEKRTDRRKDIAITWVDGEGKSGNKHAALYAEENKIWSKALLPADGFEKALQRYEDQAECSVCAVVIVDDFIGSGRSLGSNVENFVKQNEALFVERHMVLLVVALTATKRGEQKVRETLSKLAIDSELTVLHPIDESCLAFEDGGTKIWQSAEERGRAKELCQRIGQRVQRSAPLGYADQGALLVFPDTVPNNTLPLLHSSTSGQEPWNALFPRPKN